MVSRFRSRRQKAKKPLEVFGIIVVCVLGTALIVAIVQAYIFHVNVPGLSGKNLWDWLQLLIIPAVLAVGGYWFNYTTSRNEQAIASDNQSEAAMKEYFDKMSELMLHENLLKSDSDAEVRKIARVLTLTVLPRLDGNRKRRVLDFVYESGLIDKDNSIIDMNGAYLLEANLFAANLRGADLHGTILGRADLAIATLIGTNLSEVGLGKSNLSQANLRAADLSRSNLSFADLTNAKLTGALLKGTNLRGAIVTTNQLDKAASLKDAIMSDGTKHA